MGCGEIVLHFIVLVTLTSGTFLVREREKMTTNVFCGRGDRGRTRCSSQTTPFYLKAEKAALGLGQCEYSASRDIISRFRRVTKGRPRFLDGHWVSAAAFPGTPALSPRARCSRAGCVPASTHGRAPLPLPLLPQPAPRSPLPPCTCLGGV